MQTTPKPPEVQDPHEACLIDLHEAVRRVTPGGRREKARAIACTLGVSRVGGAYERGYVNGHDDGYHGRRRRVAGFVRAEDPTGYAEGYVDGVADQLADRREVP